MSSAHMKTLFRSLGLALLLGGCATGARITEANVKSPEAWHSPAPEGVAPSPLDAATQWWTFLEDPALDELVKRVRTANYDVRLAEARVREARASRQLTGTSLMPSTTINASWTASQIPAEEFGGEGSPLSVGVSNGPGGPASTISYRGDKFTISNTTSAAGATNGVTYTGEAPGGIDRTSQLFQLGLDSTWEIDIFGGKRASVKAAQANVEAVENERNAVLVSTMAEAAMAYIDLRAAQRQREITEQNIAAQERTVEITTERFRVGLSAEFDATRAQTLLDTTRAELPSIDGAIADAIHRLTLLTAEQPGALDDLLLTPAPLPHTPSEIAVGIPSDLLLRRADIRAAAAALDAAKARIRVAEADLFPKFFLNASLSGQDGGLLGIAEQAGRAWSLGPGIRWDILKSGYIKANIEVQNTRQEQAAIAYERAAATAVEEVERALTAYARENEHRAALETAVQGNEKSVALAQERYIHGLDAFLNVLQAQQQLYASRAQLVTSQATVLMNLIALYKALGGGWDAPA